MTYYLCLVVKNYSVHSERSSREHIFELVINEDGVGWVDSSLLDYMPVESDIRLSLVDSCTEKKKKENQRDVHFKPANDEENIKPTI